MILKRVDGVRVIIGAKEIAEKDAEMLHGRFGISPRETSSQSCWLDLIEDHLLP